MFKHDNVVLSPAVSALGVLSFLSLNTFMAVKSYSYTIVKRGFKVHSDQVFSGFLFKNARSL